MGIDFAVRPLNIYWEMTQACDLACRHCRAAAMPWGHPEQLTTAEGKALLRQILEFGAPYPHLILTGGDPLQRADLWELIAEARELGIPVAITPAATPRLTQAVIAELPAAGVSALGLSLDGSTAARHDGIRQVEGTFERTLQALGWGREAGLAMQVNTLVSAETVDDIPAIYERLRGSGIRRWSLFFLIPMGRGAVLQPVTPERGEALMGWALDIGAEAPFVVASTEAPSFRRLAAMRRGGAAGAAARQFGTSTTAQVMAAPGTAVHGGGHRHGGLPGVRDGHGIMFVSHRGEICPSGFLPIVAGNVRRDSIVEVYRNGVPFADLHDPSCFHDLCGVCGYNHICGGSRARAYAATGDVLGSDPLCRLVAAEREHAATTWD